MKFSLNLISFYALLAAALPQDTESYYREKCSGNELSCCSNLKSTAEANGNTIDQDQGNQNLDVENGVAAQISVLLGNTLNQVSNIVPVSILSGCSPIIGNAQITCVNYIACCVPRSDGDGHDGHEKGPRADESQCRVLKDTSVTHNPGLLGLF